MEYFEQIMQRTSGLQPRTPLWAKAEQMEAVIPQIELWKYAPDPLRPSAFGRMR